MSYFSCLFISQSICSSTSMCIFYFYRRGGRNPHNSHVGSVVAPHSGERPSSVQAEVLCTGSYRNGPDCEKGLMLGVTRRGKSSLAFLNVFSI